MLNYKDKGVCYTHLGDFFFPCKSIMGNVGARNHFA